MLRRIKSLKSICAVLMMALVFVMVGENARAITSDQATLSVNQPGLGYVNHTNGSSLIVRQGPSTSYGIITQLPYHSNIMIVERLNGWFKVQYDNAGHYGYVSASYLDEQPVDHYMKVLYGIGVNPMPFYDSPYSTSTVAYIPSGRSFLFYSFADAGRNFGFYGNVEGFADGSKVSVNDYQ